jgi:hypothetical protein
MLALVAMSCTDSPQPGSTASASIPAAASSGGALVPPWVLLEEPHWAVRKASDHPQPIPPLPQAWFVQYNSFIAPNTEASLVLAALAGTQADVEMILSAAPREWVSHADVLSHDAFALEQRSTTGSPQGTTIFWQDDSQVWMMLTGTSELTRDDVLALAGHLVVVTDAKWHEAVGSKAFNS